MKITCVGLLLTAAVAVGCVAPQGAEPVDGGESLTRSPVPTWEEYLAAAKPIETGGYVVEWDLWFPNEQALHSYYTQITDANADKAHVFTQYINGSDSDPKMFWPANKATDIRYCVSSTFGTSLTTVTEIMSNATAAWESVANINFKEVTVADCSPSEADIDLAVMPLTQACSATGLVGCAYPPIANWDTEVSPLPALISTGGSCSACNNPKHVGLAGASMHLALHELGHALGFRHERPWTDSPCSEGTQPEYFDWQSSQVGGAALGVDPDIQSVMYQASCSTYVAGPGQLSAGDGQSARALYGMPVSWYVAAGVI